MEETKGRNYYVRQLMKSMRHYHVSFVMSIITKVIAMLVPFFTFYFIAMLLDIKRGIFWTKAIALLATVVIYVFFSYLDTYVSHKMSFGIVKNLRDSCYDKIERLIPSSNVRSLGDYEKIINGDVDVFEWFYAHILVEWIATITVVVLGLGAIFFINQVGFIICFFTILLIVLLPLVKTKQAEEKGYELRNYGGQLNASIIDGILGVKDILTNHFSGEYMTGLAEKSRQFDKCREKYNRRGMNEKRTTELVIHVSTLLIVLQLVVTEGGLQLKTIMLLFFFSAKIYEIVQQTLRDGTNYGFVYGAAKRVYDLLTEEEMVKDEGKIISIEEDVKNWSLEIKNLSFQYPHTDREVIRNLNFKVGTNEIVALVAPSGSGKTTVANLIERFWDYKTGEIYINSVELRELKIHALRNYISMVPQEIYLFNMSIEDNLRLAKPDATIDEIRSACQKANATEFIRELPEGLHTVVGERGTKLSGGQKQRIAIAQAILRNTPIIIFDEATSSLDVARELEINTTLRALKKDKVILVIAHRKATMEMADRIVNLERAV
ncbi:MAG: ABC transporter ATP-binding protein/permease [Lachnospiraceae bacterium]|nr:ABC transporter ATP-binding protein/permease [Lachnospiraceae bacterium]